MLFSGSLGAVAISTLSLHVQKCRMGDANGFIPLLFSVAACRLNLPNNTLLLCRLAGDFYLK